MEYLSTTLLAKKINTERDELFKRLESHELITRDEKNNLKLTNKGLSIGGEIRKGINNETGNIYEYIVWSRKFINESGVLSDSEILVFNRNSDTATEGEDYIAEYFDKFDIDFEREVDVNCKSKFTGDNHSNRRADFFLPDYNLYVEFAGMWNQNQFQRDQYNLKKDTFSENKIPCVWIYPDNLGALHYFFNKRLELTLMEFKMRKELFKFRIRIFRKKNYNNFWGTFIGLVLTIFAITNPNNGEFLILGLIIAVYNSFVIMNDLWAIYRGNPIKVTRITNWDNY